jgi:hypothetical protein
MLLQRQRGIYLLFWRAGRGSETPSLMGVGVKVQHCRARALVCGLLLERAAKQGAVAPARAIALLIGHNARTARGQPEALQRAALQILHCAFYIMAGLAVIDSEPFS